MIKKELKDIHKIKACFDGKREHTLAQTDYGSVQCSENRLAFCFNSCTPVLRDLKKDIQGPHWDGGQSSQIPT